MVKSYEELVGALGRAVYYRPLRRRARELLSHDADPKLVVEGREYPLFDLSMNGLSLLSPESAESWPTGTELEVVLINLSFIAYASPITLLM